MSIFPDRLCNITLVWTVVLSGAPILSFALDTSDLDCLIAPRMTVELSSPVRGVLDKVLVDRGDRVLKDQVLAKLQSGVEQAAVKEARARAESNSEVVVSQARMLLATQVHDRIQELYRKKLAPLSELEEVQSKKIIAEAEVGKAKEEKQFARLHLEWNAELLKQRSLLSTINGVVVQRYKSPGEYIEQHPVLKIADDDPLHVEVVAPLTSYGSYQVGMEAEVTPNPPIGGKYVARVTIVDPVVSTNSGTFGIRLELPNSDHKIPTGIRCGIRFLPKK